MWKRDSGGRGGGGPGRWHCLGAWRTSGHCLPLAEDPIPGPSEDTRQGEVRSEGQPSPRVPVHTLGLPAPGRAGGGGAPRPHKRCWGPVAQICPERTVSTTGGVRGGWSGRGLGSAPTMSAPPGSMAACPVLGLAALLCLSAPQAGSVVQYRRPVPVVLLEPQGLAAWGGGGRGWPGGPETGSLSPVTHRSPPGRSHSPGGPSGVPAQSSLRAGQARTRPHCIPS